MYFVGITGRAKAGKHVVGGIMAAAFNDMGYTAKLDAFGLDIKCELDAADSDFNKDENRRTMQHIGAALRRQDPYCLIDNLKRRNGIGIEPFAHIWQPADILIVPDVRDEKEYQFCREHGLIVLVEGVHAPLPDKEAAHPSEAFAASLTRADVDYFITKQNGLGRLVKEADALARRIRFPERSAHA